MSLFVQNPIWRIPFFSNNHAKLDALGFLKYARMASFLHILHNDTKRSAAVHHRCIPESEQFLVNLQKGITDPLVSTMEFLEQVVISWFK